MGDLSDKFNFSALDTLESAVKKKKEYLDNDQRGIFEQFSKGVGQDKITLVARHERERVGRITKEANFMNGSPHLELGTQRLSKPIDKVEVVAMMKRANQEGLPLNQVTPHSVREQYIQYGYDKTIKREQVELGDLDRKNLVASNKLLDNLLSLDDKSLRGPEPGRAQENADQSVADAFNRAAGRTL